MAYFMSPAIRGGVMIKNAQWEKGSIVVVKTGIWFVSAVKQVCVPLSDVAAIELTKRDVQGKQTDVVRIDHVESGRSGVKPCPLPALDAPGTCEFLKRCHKRHGYERYRAGRTRPAGSHARLLRYGFPCNRNMLNIPHKQLDEIYDRIIKLGIAEVVTIRREVQLTTKGVRYISDATKTQTN